MTRNFIYHGRISFAPSVDQTKLISFTCMDRTPFTYYIAWLNQYGSIVASYYGVRFRKGCHPSDIWKLYFTSSRYVEDYYKKFGEPQIIEVRAVFDNISESAKLRTKVQCPHCDKHIPRNVAPRFHFDKCKSKPQTP